MTIRDTMTFWGLVLTLTLVGCDDDSAPEGEWGGQVHDSTGVAVVVNPTTGVWTPSTAWRLQEDLRIGPAQGNTEAEFGRVVGVAVSASGQIYILDRQAQHIRVFSAGGEFMHTIGQGGSGPGELAGPSTILIGVGDTILVPDLANRRVQRFLTDGSEAGTIPIPLTDGIPLGWRMRDDGLLLEEIRTLPDAETGEGEGQTALRARAIDGEVAETLVEMPLGKAVAIRDGQQMMTVFAPESHWTALDDGRIATGWNADYQLLIHSPTGKVERIISKPFERQSFPDSHRRALRDLLSQQFEGQPPSPATEQMLRTLNYADFFGSSLIWMG